MIRAEQDALVLAMQAEAEPPPPRRRGNPLITAKQADECYAGGWDDAEIDAFTARAAQFTRMGRAAGTEHLAERLTLRYHQRDDRELCLECEALAENRRGFWPAFTEAGPRMNACTSLQDRQLSS